MLVFLTGLYFNCLRLIAPTQFEEHGHIHYVINMQQTLFRALTVKHFSSSRGLRLVGVWLIYSLNVELVFPPINLRHAALYHNPIQDERDAKEAIIPSTARQSPYTTWPIKHLDFLLSCEVVPVYNMWVTRGWIFLRQGGRWGFFFFLVYNWMCIVIIPCLIVYVFHNLCNDN